MDDFRQVTGLGHATSDDTVRLARTAAEAVRGLNHLTGHDAGLAQPSAAYDITGALALAAGRLGHDLGEDPAAAIGAAAVFLGGARTSAAALAGDLDAAQQQLALINGTPRNRTPEGTS